MPLLAVLTSSAKPRKCAAGLATIPEEMRVFTAAGARSRIASMAESMGIQDDLDRQVRTFSTGMMHRLGLARALLHSPAVLLLDEPTRSLDPLAAADLRRLLRDDLVRARGTTLLFAS